ncbi:MAG: hypothetical protein NTX50_03345 [Candidatus Sumerlaeota bacterium]|nr:hypothetical protein [Candidatus Sumerlaeota bacterium]
MRKGLNLVSLAGALFLAVTLSAYSQAQEHQHGKGQGGDRTAARGGDHNAAQGGAHGAAAGAQGGVQGVAPGGVNAAQGGQPGGQPGGGQGGRQGGRPGGGNMDPAQMQAMRDSFQAMQSVQSYWLVLSADPKFEDAKLTALRPAFQKAWEARDKARSSMRDPGGMTSATAAMKIVSEDLEKELKKVLTEDQLAKLKEATAAMGGNRGGGPGGGAPGGGGAPATGAGAPGGGTRNFGAGGAGAGGAGGAGTHNTHNRGTDTGTGGKSATGAPAAGF